MAIDRTKWWPRMDRVNSNDAGDGLEGVTCMVVHPGSELFGSDRMALESVRGLIAAGLRVIVALPDRGPLALELERAGATTALVPMLVARKSLLHPRSWLSSIFVALRSLTATMRLLRRERPAVVYVSTITIPLWPILARLGRARVISHVHEAEASGSGLINALLYAPHLVADEVLVNSRFSLATIQMSLPAVARRARVVYNGVIGPPAEGLPRMDVDELRVLYVGRLSPRKGVEDVVRAAHTLHARDVPVRVSLLGGVFSGYEWFEDDLRALAAVVPDVPIDFLGFNPDIWEIIAEHDVLVVPSRVDEPFGNTAVEGILARRIVVASDTSGLREAAGGYSTALLVPPSDPTALADALEQVRSRWTSLRSHLEASARQAQEKHSPVRYRTEVAAAVEKACRAGRAPKMISNAQQHSRKDRS